MLINFAARILHRITDRILRMVARCSAPRCKHPNLDLFDAGAAWIARCPDCSYTDSYAK